MNYNFCCNLDVTFNGIISQILPEIHLQAWGRRRTPHPHFRGKLWVFTWKFLFACYNFVILGGVEGDSKFSRKTSEFCSENEYLLFFGFHACFFSSNSLSQFSSFKATFLVVFLPVWSWLNRINSSVTDGNFGSE